MVQMKGMAGSPLASNLSLYIPHGSDESKIFAA